MNTGLNKERVVFLLGAALFVWVMVKLLVFWHQPPLEAGTPKISIGTIHEGDAKLRHQLALPGRPTPTAPGPGAAALQERPQR